MNVLSACGEMSSKLIFEAFVNEAASWTNNDYGGLNIAATRVVYVHGSGDPWHALGMTTTEESDTPVIFIRGTAHAAIMDPSTKEDKQSTPWAGVVKARSPKLLSVLAGASVTLGCHKALTGEGPSLVGSAQAQA